ncbi:MAG TPA: Tc toxin subunit A, partial [Ktedonobacteraceae bacterium]|nr:Tc toxin subunit A [Ktedonobacteraceae bacterium]
AYHLEVSGQVDEVTASKLNERLLALAGGEEHEEHRQEHEEHEEHEEHREEHEERGDEENGDEDDHKNGNGHGKGGEQRYVVKGTVRDANGDSLANLTVQVFEKTLRKEQMLAFGQTMTDGTYTITYRPPSTPQAAASPSFNIVVKVLNQQGEVWLVSPVIFGAKPLELVDLMDGGVYTGLSAFETVMAAIQPSLDGLPVAQLVETDDHPDITFVASDSKQDPEHIMQLVVSHLLSQTTDLPPELFYAFLRQNLPTTVPKSLLAASDKFKKIDVVLHNTLAGIAALTPDVQKNALDHAFQKNLIPLRLKAEQDQILQKLQALRVSNTLEQPYLTGKVSLKTMLSLSVLPDTLYTQFAQLYLSSGGTSHNFWLALAKQSGFTPDVVADLRLTLGVGSMVKNYPSAVTFLKQGFQQQTYTTLQDLAKLDINAWETIVKQTGYPSNITGATENDKISVFAHEIFARVEQAFPTTSFVAQVARSQVSLVQYQPQVVQFFNDNPTLNLKRIHVDRYLKDNGEQALRNIPVELRAPVIQQAKAMQRVLRLAPTTNAATALLSMKIHTAQQIYFTAQSTFVTNAVAQGATKTAAQRVYQRAGQTYAMTLARIAELNAQFNGPAFSTIPSSSPNSQTAQQLKDYPDLQTLFGSLDYCTCDECNSVLGAAAYLVDLLLFLKQRTTAGVTAKDVFLKRRPDVGTLLLNCENTNTALPYIDLVCELLEEEIAPTGQGRQTTWTEDELRANPQYVNAPVYNTNLVQAHYPNTLPFNLWLEEARVYLNHLGVSRTQLMKTFQNRAASPSVPSDSDIAAEYFGISPEEEALICNADAANQPTYWGETDPVTTLKIVATFLQQSGLSYNQLLALLAVGFIQDSPATSVLQSTSNACDTQQQTITNLSLSRLDKMHRFIRMWRKTSWQMWELDRLILSPKIGNGTLD